MPSLEYMKAWRAAHPGYRAAEYQRRKMFSPTYKTVTRDAKKRFRIRHLERIRLEDKLAKSERRKTINGIAYGKAKALKATGKRIAEQELIAGRSKPQFCELCLQAQTDQFSTKIVFDHCHTSGNFRGWICDRCNRVLGLIGDNSSLAIKLANYLNRSGYGSSLDITA